MTCLKEGHLWDVSHHWNWQNTLPLPTGSLPRTNHRHCHWEWAGTNSGSSSRRGRQPGHLGASWMVVPGGCCLSQTSTFSFIGLQWWVIIYGQVSTSYSVKGKHAYMATFFLQRSVVCGRIWGKYKMRASLVSAGSRKPSGKITASAYLWLLWEKTE